ncbi:hypothetical protein LOCC1_G001427 [Lachnellula occidentalis]|uniref:DUF3824 domain-containing protein n=1 Tax=Lachnellula occidentalis TaxID=215460 RepID=A0A8H8UK56_9HELO|nr:hypothetical protein LOCC1_G001427 [Lachnellula occidentalis]
MSTMDPYDRVDDRRHRSHRHSRDDREPRYVETEETYVRTPAAPEAPYAVRHTELVRRPHREDSDLSIEEVRRDFPPPGSRSVGRDDRYGPSVRSRSAERGYGDYLDDPRRSYHDDDRRSRKSQTYADQEVVKPRRRSLSRNQKIIAGVGGAALALAGKELWDRKQADGRPVSRNPLQSAAVGAAGAFAAYEGAEMYAKHGGKEKIKTYISHKGRDGEVDEYYSSEEEKPKTKSRRKSIVEGALGLAGLGAAAKATGGSGRSRRGSGDSHRSTRSRSRAGGRGKSPEGAAKFQQAAKAALLAGATEAFRVRNEPGGWGGAKGKRILTAAIGAGGIDAAADRNPGSHGKRHILEAVVGGLAGNRLINGSRKDVEDDDGRSSRGGRSRSRARSRSKGPGGSGAGAGLAALATAGIGAIAGKKLLDHSRSRSRGDNRSRSRGGGRRRGSPDSYDSRSPSPKGGKDRHKRSKSVTDYARKGLAAIGLGEAASESGGRDRDRDVDYEETRVHKSSRRRRRDGSDDGYEPRGSRGSRDDDYSQRGSGGVYDDPRYADSRSSNLGSTRDGGGRRSGGRAKQGGRDRRVAEGKQDASDSDSLGSSSEDEKKIKKMKGKQLLTAGLATVATIHAAHNIYQSIEKRDARHRAVKEGEMTPEEARKLKAKATLQDAASVGIAALGIKGAISEIKEANEMRHECKVLNEEKAERHRKRLERQKKRTGSSTSGSRRDDDYYDQVPSGRRLESGGPRYTDGNPYSTGRLPAPPVGYDDYDRR